MAASRSSCCWPVYPCRPVEFDVERQSLDSFAPLLCMVFAGQANENMAHHPSREREEMPSIVNLHAAGFQQFDEQLVDQFRRLKVLAWIASAHKAGGD